MYAFREKENKYYLALCRIRSISVDNVFLLLSGTNTTSPETFFVFYFRKLSTDLLVITT